jgi:dolichol-phosphate mannosyltransferase
VSDLTGSFRLYRKSLFEELILSVKSSGYAFQMEMAVIAKYKGYKIEEVPIVFVDRIYGSSKLGFDEILIYFRAVMRLYATL